jgi:hypothetical protein
VLVGGPAINGEARCSGGFGRGRGEVAARGSARRTDAQHLEGEESRDTGEAALGCGSRRGEERGGARPEVGDGPDRWAPPVGGCVRGREAGALAGCCGPKSVMGRGGK